LLPLSEPFLAKVKKNVKFTETGTKYISRTNIKVPKSGYMLRKGQRVFAEHVAFNDSNKYSWVVIIPTDEVIELAIRSDLFDRYFEVLQPLSGTYLRKYEDYQDTLSDRL